MSRGDRKNDIFHDDWDRQRLLDTIAEACERNGWMIHAYVFMNNHYHLLLETPEPNLVTGMKWVQGTYTQRFNTRHRECGHLFQGRYKALVVQSDRGDYFSTVANYIHLNPVRAHIMNFEDHDLASYQWSSYPLYFDLSKRPEWLCVSRVLGSFQLMDNTAGLNTFCRTMNRRAVELYSCDDPVQFEKRWRGIRRGWCLGDDDFRAEMEDRIDARISSYNRRSYLGKEAQIHDERAAGRLLSKCLELIGIRAEQLQCMQKCDPRKKLMAWMIRRKTSVSNRWICENLAMGHVSNLARYINDIEESNDEEVVRLREMTKKAF